MKRRCRYVQKEGNRLKSRWSKEIKALCRQRTLNFKLSERQVKLVNEKGLLYAMEENEL